MNNALTQMIRAMVQSEIANAVREMINVDPIADNGDTDTQGRGIDDPNFGIPAKQSNNGGKMRRVDNNTWEVIRRTANDDAADNVRQGALLDNQTRRGSKRGRGRAKVAYQLIPRPKGQRWPQMVGNPDAVLAVLRKADTPLTNAELEVATGMGTKSVQSAVHLLRTVRLIKSVPVPTARG